MIIGDFNLIDSMYDKPINVKVSNNKKLDKEWEEIRKNIDIVDPFRRSHPKLRVYSFESKDKRRRSRVDKLDIDEEDVEKFTKNIYIKTNFDDHKILEAHYKGDRNRGRGTWKLNTSLLEDKQYTKRIRLAIERYLN